MKLTFDTQHGCHCPQFPHTVFTVEFQDRLCQGDYDEAKLLATLLRLETDRIDLQHSNAVCDNFDYLQTH